MAEAIKSLRPRPAIVAGFSSQPLAEQIALELGSKVVSLKRRQFDDKEIQTTIEENVRGLDVVVIACASGDWDERNSPALNDTIETLRDHCQGVVVADPHNATLSREKFLDTGSPVKSCITVHFAFPFAMKLRELFDTGRIGKENFLFSHADAGSTKRISRSFRACLYNAIGLPGRNADEDDWPQGLKDRESGLAHLFCSRTAELWRFSNLPSL